VILGITGIGGSHALEEVALVARGLPQGVELLAGGMQGPEASARVAAAGARPLADFDALEEALRRLGARF
jgi:hypothetical protein